jgi:hypothetical protein
MNGLELAGGRAENTSPPLFELAVERVLGHVGGPAWHGHCRERFSRRRRALSPSDEVVGGLFVNFEPFRTSPRHAAAAPSRDVETLSEPHLTPSSKGQVGTLRPHVCALNVIVSGMSSAGAERPSHLLTPCKYWEMFTVFPVPVSPTIMQ